MPALPASSALHVLSSLHTPSVPSVLPAFFRGYRAFPGLPGTIRGFPGFSASSRLFLNFRFLPGFSGLSGTLPDFPGPPSFFLAPCLSLGDPCSFPPPLAFPGLHAFHSMPLHLPRLFQTACPVFRGASLPAFLDLRFSAPYRSTHGCPDMYVALLSLPAKCKKSITGTFSGLRLRIVIEFAVRRCPAAAQGVTSCFSGRASCSSSCRRAWASSPPSPPLRGRSRSAAAGSLPAP